jgi:hypothetical protein
VYFEGDAAIGGVIQTVALTGGTPHELKRMDFIPYGISWGSPGILFARGFGKDPKGIVQLTTTDGKEQMLIPTGDDFPQMPQWLPDGDSVLFTLASGVGPDRWNDARVVVHALKSGTRTTVIDGGGDARYLTTGHIVYARGTKVFVALFDPAEPGAIRMPVEVLDNVLRVSPIFDSRALLAVSTAGTLAYRIAPKVMSELAWVERDGRVRPIGKQPATYRFPRLSPDEESFAVDTEDGDTATIWIGDFETGHALRRLTFGQRDRFPTWSPDGQFIVFQSERDGRGGLFRQRADGTSGAERLTTAEPGTSHEPESWSPDGGTLLFRIGGARYSSWSYSFMTHRIEPFGGIESDIPPNATFSPDGKWVTYMWRSTNNQFLIFAQRFPADGTKYQVVEGGITPAWGADGRSIFYYHGAGIFARVDVATSPVFAPGVPVDLAFKFGVSSAPTAHRDYDTAKDGRVFGLKEVREPDAAPPGVQVVLNWLQDIRK